MAPARCRRMIGTTCLHAMIVPRRLIAETRSKASSVSSRSGLSPPAMLTPTLLCRMSIRPQRRSASAIAAARVASCVTSAEVGHALAAFLRRQRRGLLGRGEVAVDGEDTGALLGEAQYRGAAVADAFAGALAGADDDRDLAGKAHGRAPSGLPPQHVAAARPPQGAAAGRISPCRTSCRGRARKFR